MRVHISSPSSQIRNDDHADPAKLETSSSSQIRNDDHADLAKLETSSSSQIRNGLAVAKSETMKAAGRSFGVALRAFYLERLPSAEVARRFGYDDAQARQIFRDLIDMPADVAITENEIRVRFHRRAHLPIVLASGLIDKTVTVPW